MLTADQLDVLPGPILELYERFHTSIIEDIARRVAGLNYASAAWQVQRLSESGLLYKQILERIGEITGQSDAVLSKIFKRAGVDAMAFDDAIYKAAGLKPLPLNLSPQMMQLLVAGLNRTAGTMRGLIQTTAVSGQEAFLNASDLAYMQISTGTLDYNTAIREAVKEVAVNGVDVVHYASGHRDRINVAMRRTVLTGVNQTVGEMQITRAEEMGTELVQTSAHIGARNKGTGPANHEGWQGRVFSLKGGSKKYPNFEEETGYGTVTGLGGVNCRHSFYPWFEGISQNAYDQATLDNYASKTVTYNGKEMSFYEGTQVQRKLEREIRAAKREAAAVDAAGLDNSGELQKVRDLQGDMREFTRQTGLKRQYVREQSVLIPKLENISETGKKIEFSSYDYQHIANLGDIQSNFQADDIGRMFATQRPVIYNRYAASHLTGDTHRKRIKWLEENQEGLIRAILSPDFIERNIRLRDDGHFSITLISELFSGGKKEGRFITVAISLSKNIEKGYHQITTIHPASWEDLFYVDGELKKKFIRIK